MKATQSKKTPEKAHIEQLIMLDVGCGEAKNEGFIGMDKRKLPSVDIVHDAEQFPWPLSDESCAVVVMSHFVEHVKPWLQIDLINECWRVLKMGGVLAINVPHALSFGYLQDPTHCCPWNEATPTYFIYGEPLYSVYKPLPWIKERLFFNRRGNIELALRKMDIPKEVAASD